jgi:predicted transcriptional regulator
LRGGIVDLLRNKGQLTRMLVLNSIVVGGKRAVNSIAEAVDITPQGASEYLSAMEAEGMVVRDRAGIRPTVAGVESLQRSLLSLKGFVDRSIEGLDIVRSTDAISECAVRKGDRVGLRMMRGLLYAGPTIGASWGIADTDAGVNEMVQVSNLTGVLEMARSPIRLVTLPPARTGGGGCRLEKARLDSRMAELGVDTGDLVVAALDLEGAAMLLRSGIQCSLEMPDAETLLGYHDRGRPVLAFGAPYSTAVLEEGLAKLRPSGCTERDHRIVPV